MAKALGIDVSTKQTANGTEVVLYSKRQSLVFDNQTKPDTVTSKTKIITQHSDGTIVLHKFFLTGDMWMGYAVTIGPRGGKQALHNYFVTIDDGELVLNLR